MVRAAITGFGFMGMTHAFNILKNDKMQLAAIADINIGSSGLAGGTGNLSTGSISIEEFRNINKYTSLDHCLRSEELDAVHVCVHTALHYEMVKKCLLSGKHVLVEKPFCLDIKQGEELIELAEKKGKVLMVGHVVRFMPAYRKLKDMIGSGEFGRLKFLSLSRFCGIPAWGQWKENNVISTSGGALFDLVIHDIDFASYILGIPAEISSNSAPGMFGEHDYISAMWKYNDVNVKIEGGNFFHSSFPFRAGYVAHFEKASISYTSSRGDVITVSDNEKTTEIPAGDQGDGYFREIDYFADCIMKNSKPAECMPESSLLSVELCYKHIKK